MGFWREFRDKIFVISAQHEPTFGGFAFFDILKTFHRARPAVYDITRHNDFIGLPFFNIFNHGLQCYQVCMNVGNYSDKNTRP